MLNKIAPSAPLLPEEEYHHYPQLMEKSGSDIARPVDAENSPSNLAKWVVRMLRADQQTGNKSDKPTAILPILSKCDANKVIENILQRLVKIDKISSELKIDVNLISQVHEAAMEQLIQEGADINAPDDEVGYSPLHHAAMGNVSALKILLKYKADLRQTDTKERAALECAYDKGAKECKLELINATMKDPELINKPHRPQKKSEKYRNSDTLLHEAAASNKDDLVIRLLQHGADPNLRNQNGTTPLHRAYTPEIVKALLDQKADAKAKNNVGDTPLHRMIQNRRAGVESVKLLLKAGASVLAANEAGKTPLDIAVEMKNQEIISILVGQAVESKKAAKEKANYRVAQVWPQANANTLYLDLTHD